MRADHLAHVRAAQAERPAADDQHADRQDRAPARRRAPALAAEQPHEQHGKRDLHAADDRPHAGGRQPLQGRGLRGHGRQSTDGDGENATDGDEETMRPGGGDRVGGQRDERVARRRRANEPPRGRGATELRRRENDHETGDSDGTPPVDREVHRAPGGTDHHDHDTACDQRHPHVLAHTDVLPEKDPSADGESDETERQQRLHDHQRYEPQRRELEHERHSIQSHRCQPPGTSPQAAKERHTGPRNGAHLPCLRGEQHVGDLERTRGAYTEQHAGRPDTHSPTAVTSPSGREGCEW